MHMYSGDFVASCSMDHTAKLWDVQRAKCRGTLRGHVDSINAIIFQPFSNNICTCAGDKTVSRAAVYMLYINIYVYMCMYVYMYVYRGTFWKNNYMHSHMAVSVLCRCS